MTLKKVIIIFDPVINDFKDPMFRVILKCKDHPTILAIQNKWKNDNKSVFEETNLASIKKQIHNVKENIDIFAEFLWTSISSSIKSSTFPSCLKSADVTHLHKKVIKDKKGNYSLVSILPTLSKCFEKCIFRQMSACFDEIFSKYQYGFRKGYSTQQCLLVVQEPATEVLTPFLTKGLTT